MRSKLQIGDYAVFHSDMNSGIVEITAAGICHLPVMILSMGSQASLGDRLDGPISDPGTAWTLKRTFDPSEPKPAIVRERRRAWLKKHPEIVKMGRTEFYRRAFDDAGLGES